MALPFVRLRALERLSRFNVKGGRLTAAFLCVLLSWTSWAALRMFGADSAPVRTPAWAGGCKAGVLASQPSSQAEVYGDYHDCNQA